MRALPSKILAFASALSDADRRKIFEGNARKVYPRINQRIPQ